MRNSKDNLFSENLVLDVYMMDESFNCDPQTNKNLCSEQISLNESELEKGRDEESVYNWSRRRTYWYALLLGMIGATLASSNIIVSYITTILLFVLTLDVVYHFFAEMFRKHWQSMMGAVFYVIAFGIINYGNYKLIVKMIEDLVYM